MSLVLPEPARGRETVAEALPGPVAIPVAIVDAIARAAVEAYIEQKRIERRAYDTAYRRVNAEHLRALARARYARKQQQHAL